MERGRESCAAHAWIDAFESLTAADQAQSLGVGDLERLARAAYMVGRDDDYVGALERAHQAHLDAGDSPEAVRASFWIGHNFLFRGESVRAAGWFARGRRILDEHGQDCVEHGWLLIPTWLAQMGGGDYVAGYNTAGEAGEIAERFGDLDLMWIARDEQARALVNQGRVSEGLRLVDEALVVAVTGELSPIVTGIVYCNTIAFCRDAYEMRHVREWTEALTRWCDRQPEMVAHNGLCLVHRAEVKLLGGNWGAALDDARRCEERFTRGTLNQIARGKAHYCQAETHRLMGDFAAAETAYQQASKFGCEVQPGLALMRLAQGTIDAAAATIRRAVAETTDSLRRVALLPEYVEIMLAAQNLDSARAACMDLDGIAEHQGSEVLVALAAKARGAVALADGRPIDALAALRQALGIWTELAAPYEAARVRVLVGLACRALEDEDTARLELEAARAAFAELGAVTDRDHLDAVTARAEAGAAHGLTDRELEVLRLVATGRSNREVAGALFISEHTVARHVQNIFAKLAVSSRTAATAFAFAHDLV